MLNNFTRLRLRARVAAAIFAVLTGLGIGVIVLAGMILASKISAEAMQGWQYSIPAAVVVVSIAALLGLFLPTDKRLARQLDEEHHLDERVRTMIALRDEDDVFAQVQREDAEEKLSEIKFNPRRPKQLIAMILALVLAVTCLTTALVIPAQAPYEEPEEPLSAFDKQWILTELGNVIDTVEASLIADTLKASLLSELRSLYSFVEAHEYASEMKIEAIKTVIRTDAALDDENTALPLGSAFAACTNAKLKELGAELIKLNGTGVQKKLGELKDSLESAGDDEISFAADELSAAIDASDANATSPLVMLLSNLSSAIRGYANGNSTADDAFGTVRADALNQVMVQSINKLVTESVISRLCSLFGITVDDLVNAGADEDINITPPTQRPAEGDEEEDEGDGNENEEMGSGGIGTGDRVYGSNDMIYNPYTNEYVPYGQVFDEYNNKVLQMVEDGRIPPDFEEFIKEYFRSLSDYTPEE